MPAPFIGILPRRETYIGEILVNRFKIFCSCCFYGVKTLWVRFRQNITWLGLDKDHFFALKVITRNMVLQISREFL